MIGTDSNKATTFTSLPSRKWYHRFTSLILVFSMLCAFVGPLDLFDFGLVAKAVDNISNSLEIIQMNGNGGKQNNGDYFYISVADADGNEFYNNYPAEGNPGGQGQTNYEATGDSIGGLNLSMKYHIAEANMRIPEFNDSTIPNMYVNLGSLWNAGFTLDDFYKTGPLLDSAYTSASSIDTAGTFNITDDGYALLFLTTDYLDYLKKRGNYGQIESDGTATGTLDIFGTLYRAESESGDRTFTIADQTVTVNFSDRYPTITKEATVNKNDGTVTWNITINNQYGADLQNYTVTDLMFPNLTSIQVDTLNGTLTNSTDYSVSGSTLTFNTSQTAGRYFIDYITPITDDMLKQGSQSNTASLHSTKQDAPSSWSGSTDDGWAGFNNPKFTVNKTGTPDYMSGTRNGKINWSITVTSEYGTSLDGYVISDSLIQSGTVVAVEPSSVSATVGNGTVTLNGNAKSVTLTYSTDVTNPNTTQSVYNKAELKYPGGNDDTQVFSDGWVQYKSESDLYQFNKQS